jgi:hypothetical protein
MDDDCSYDGGHSDYTESENSSDYVVKKGTSLKEIDEKFQDQF